MTDDHYNADDIGPEDLDSICTCENPEIVRTLAKGTPAEKRYCSCGGRVRD